MDEYSRIIIEEYCRTNSKTKKSKTLGDLVKMSYDIACEPSDAQMIELSRIISREKNQELKEALMDLDDFLCC